MALFGKKKKTPEEEHEPSPNGEDGAPPTAATEGEEAVDRRVVSDADKDKARQWFQRARTVADTRNYDYAIECYTSGLELWPEAVEEGHMKMRLVAAQRHAAGNKKASASERMAHRYTKKDAFRNMLNAEYLWAKDPQNIGYMEAFFKNAIRAGCYETAMWFGPTYFEAAAKEKKPNVQRMIGLRNLYEELAEGLSEREMPEASCEAYKRAIDALQIAQRIKPGDAHLGDDARELATRMTIVRGRFATAGTFKDSVRDKGAQKDLHDQQRMVQSDVRIEELIAKAREEIAAAPDNPSKLATLADLLCKRERKRDEDEAIALLEKAYADTNQQHYRLRMLADDIRLKQYRRAKRRLAEKRKADPTDATLERKAQALAARQLQTELEIYASRTKAYPTDHGIRFDYGRCLFQAGEYDEAIPVFQQARADPKNRIKCGAYIGRCFYEKKFYQQATVALREAVESYEIEGDETAKELRYWLARSLEAEGNLDEARKGFGQLLQWDYNYRDVRLRMDKLASQ